MPRVGAGQIRELRAGGGRHPIPLGVVSRADAERELAFVMADVARGVWKPRTAAEQPIVEVPTFHEFAEQWWVRVEGRIAESTKADYRWRLEEHLLAYFGEIRLDAITIDTVESYIAAKLSQGEKVREAAAAGDPLVERVTDKRGR